MKNDTLVYIDEINKLKTKIIEIENQNQVLNSKLAEYEIENAILQSLSSRLDKGETIEAIRILFQSRFDFDQFALLLLESKNRNLTIATSYGLTRTMENAAFELNKGIFNLVTGTKEYTYFPDLSEEPQHDLKYYLDNNSGSFLWIPLFSEGTRAFGILGFYRKQTNAFANAEITYLFRLTHQVASVLHKTILYKHTKALSITDSLTGIFNRRYFDERFEREVQRARRYKRALSVLMIDIDHFKIYNDTHGHLMGDEVLKRVAILLESNLRRVDFLARYGGEEFVILLPEIDFKNGKLVAERLRRTIEQSHFFGEEELPQGRVTISIGLSSYRNENISTETLLNFADKGLYLAKTSGRNRVGYVQENNMQAKDGC